MKKLLVPTTALMWGVQYAFLQPVIALLLVNLYGASAADVGWSMTIYNAAGFVSSLVLPTWADRRKEYLLPLMVAGVLTVGLAGALWWVSSLPMAVAALVVLGGPAGMGAGLLFAHLRHAGYRREAIVNVRSIMAFAWVAGPPLATLIMGTFGDRAILPTLLVLGLGNIWVTWMMMRQQASLTEDERSAASAQPVGPTPWLTVIVVGVSMVLLQATNVAAVAVIGLHVTQELGLDLRWAGLALGLCAAIEVPLLIWVGRLSRRFSSLGLMVAGSLAAVGYYVALAFTSGVVVLLAIQVLNAFFFAVVGGISLTWFLEVLPRPGLATTISSNVRRVGGIVSGPLIAVAGYTSYGYRAVWVVCAALAVIAVVAIVVIGRRDRRADGASDEVAPEPAPAS